MDTDLKKTLLVAECTSMVLLLNDRTGDRNPWAAIDFSSMAVEELAESKRLMHELLYAPPARQ